MVSFFRTAFLPQPRRVTAIILAFAFLAGLCAGAYAATLAGTNISSLMRTASTTCVSIAGLLPALLLPFLFTAFAVYISQYWLLIPIAFVKAFLFSYLGATVLLLFQDSGWLVQLLLMFADCLSLPVLWWLWLRLCCDGQRKHLRCYIGVFVAIAGIVCLDYQIISPFLVDLLS